MASFNINKVICINLKSHDEKQLKKISEIYVLSYEALLRTKLRGTHKIWIEPGNSYAIAALETSNIEDFYICEKYCPISKKEREMVKKIKPITSQNLKKEKIKDEKSSESKISKVTKEASNIVNLEKERSEIIELKDLDLDQILDKINLKGINSLTKEELNFLKRF